MYSTREGLIVPATEGFVPVEGLDFNNAIVPCTVNFSEPTSRALARLSITAHSRRAAFFGDVNDPEMYRVAESFVSSLGDNSEEDIKLVSSTIVNLTKSSTAITGDEAAWLELRGGCEKHPFYDEPRWHPDGTYFDTHPKKALYKFATTLVGASTRLGVSSDRERFMRALESNDEVQAPSAEGVALRRKLGLDGLVDEIAISELGDGAFFLTGHDAAAIHSEPPADGPRLFMFALGGPLERIQALGSRRKES